MTHLVTPVFFFCKARTVGHMKNGRGQKYAWHSPDDKSYLKRRVCDESFSRSFFSMCTFFLFVCASAMKLEKPNSPNIIVILTDDQGWGDLSLSGNMSIETPHIDQLATDGARFQHFYVSPVCSPTRAEFFNWKASRSLRRVLHVRGWVNA